MNIIKPSFKIEQCLPYEEALRIIELATRTAYKSEEFIKKGSAEKLIRTVLKTNRRQKLIQEAKAIIGGKASEIEDLYEFYSDSIAEDIVDLVLDDMQHNPSHESVIEHVVVSVRFIFDRAVGYELIRHRIGAYTQESTRYCNYGHKGITIADVPFWPYQQVPEKGVQLFLTDAERDQYETWLKVMNVCTEGYNKLLSLGATPEKARTVLPQSTKTEIFTTYNLREWRHVFKLRTSPRAHPQMREVMDPLLVEMKQRLPVFFEDI